MQEIDKYNCDGLCVQRYCDERYTKFTTKEINGVELHLAFCDKHAEEFEHGR